MHTKYNDPLGIHKTVQIMAKSYRKLVLVINGRKFNKYDKFYNKSVKIDLLF